MLSFQMFTQFTHSIQKIIFINITTSPIREFSYYWTEAVNSKGWVHISKNSKFCSHAQILSLAINNFTVFLKGADILGFHENVYQISIRITIGSLSFIFSNINGVP